MGASAWDQEGHGDIEQEGEKEVGQRSSGKDDEPLPWFFGIVAILIVIKEGGIGIFCPFIFT
jgi:hypothetical protein